MCTATLNREPGRLLLTMNRDERRDRAPEKPPAVFGTDDGAAAWTAPIDGPSGGTWVGVNDQGVVAALLNAYQPGDKAGHRRGAPSRGRIIPALLHKGSFQEALSWFGNVFDPAAYRSFTLVVATKERDITFRWLGEGSLETEESDDRWRFWSSSSWRTGEVLSWREAQFRLWKKDGAPFAGHIPSVHLLQPGGLAEWAPLMARSYAATRSITQIELSQNTTTLRYWPRPEEASGDPAATTSLDLS